jgi:hypothetical protein
MTNELSSFDEFNGITSCLDDTIRFLSQLSKIKIYLRIE